MRKTAYATAIVLAATVGWAIAPAASHAFEHRFSTTCKSSHMAIDDPIVSPGTTASHLHAFFGNVSTNRFSTYDSMIVSGTTCSIAADTAGYWVPTLIAPDGSVVPTIRTNAYYRTNGVFNGIDISAFPADLRLVSSRYEWLCKDNQVFGSPPDCSTSERGFRPVGLRVIFPSCWDGVQLDSFDHRSHMAFGSVRRGCPASHPIALPRLAMNVRYATTDATGYLLSSGDPSTAHADFWNTWNQKELERLVAECLGVTAVRACGLLN